MTGFGTATHETDSIIVLAEVRSLNSKFLDVNLRLPRNFPADKEMELRAMLKDALERGKIGAMLEYQFKNTTQTAVSINEAAFKAYYQRLSALAQEMQADPADAFRLALQMPDVMTQELRRDNTGEEQWEVFKACFAEALARCIAHRQAEGTALAASFEDCVAIIHDRLQRINTYDPQRIAQIRERVQGRVQEIAHDELFDRNRFEQEMIYYLEKLDITEEKVRLQNHIDYFRLTMKDPNANGRKLNFISQEMGREINTIGSKANDAEVQRWVVEMKDELEKIKEQTMNIL